MKKKVTIKDVAKASGVSITTVSMILNNQGGRFSKETVEKVLVAKKALSYEPNYFAQKMIMKHSYTIGVLVSDLSNPFFNQLVQGIQKELILKGYLLILCDTSLNEQLETNYLEELVRREVDGIIIASAVGDPKQIRHYLDEKEIPFVFLDQQQDEKNSLNANDYEGGKLVAEHLLSYGHRKIAIVYPKNLPQNIETRKKGFVERLAKEKIAPVFISCHLSKKGGYQVVDVILKKKGLTAIFAVNDEIVIGLYRGLKEKGKKIPEDYSIVGYDDIPISSYLDPKLTTIHQPIQELGQKASSVILEGIEKGTMVKQEILPISFVLRDSTKKLEK